MTPQAIAELCEAEVDLTSASAVVVGIDAPLGFPQAYAALVAGDPGRSYRPARDIEDRFAYRDAERYIFETFGKKPMSAPHNMLGANATVAISYTRAWRGQGYATLPFDGAHAARACIEVYPALEKTKGLLHERWAALGIGMPETVKPGTDAYDAAICALLALAFCADGRHGLPRLASPPEAYIQAAESEGWVYARDVGRTT